MKKQTPCQCAAYPFPHRVNGGKCDGLTSTCSHCGEPSDTVETSESEPFEFWGQRGTHVNRYDVSRCCGADLE